MKVRVVTLGCKLNFAESSALMNTLLAKGCERAKQGEAADIVIVNTCTVTDTADHKDRQAIHRLKRENPGAKIIVTGCYAALMRQKQERGDQLSQADTAILQEIDHLIPKDPEHFHAAYSRDDRTRCFLKVQDGCNYFCTYCTIPFARGRSRNPHISHVVTEAQQALNEGAKEIILTGVNIGDFGRSTGESFIDLLRALDQLDTPSSPTFTDIHPHSPTFANIHPHSPSFTDYRIRISSCEPNLLTDEIIDFVAQSRHFAPHFHIPLQSGNNEVLKIMHRHYTRELFQERIEHIRRVIPHAFIGVDCMVGVRGETQERWQDYLEFVQQLPVSQLHVFTYSERANTRMLEMDLEVVAGKERERRSRVLHQVSQDKAKDFYQKHNGQQAVVLWESKKSQDGLMFGFTENYIKVSCPYDKAKINQFQTITIGCDAQLS